MKNLMTDSCDIKKIYSNIQTIVIKIGSSIISSDQTNLDRYELAKITDQIVKVLRNNINVIIVSSGAIASGMELLGLKARPTLLPKQQACAAIGQNKLMSVYSELFKIHNYKVGQILLTREDINDRHRYLNAKNTILTLLELGVIPIINENDTVATDEIKFGDNDTLSGLVAVLINADLLVLLSDVDGLYCFNKKMDIVKTITDDIIALARPTSKSTSVGGMVTKIETARIVVQCGIPMVIANGRKENIILDILDGKQVGTLFIPKSCRFDCRRHWIAFASKVKGHIAVDSGARDALTKKNKSLLSSGIVSLKGKFDIGDTVTISTSGNENFAKGITNYSSDDLCKIKGQKTTQIQKILGYKYYDEVVHRDNLAILE